MNTLCHHEVKNSIRINELRDLLGHDVLLLHWPLGSKGTKKKWRHLTIESMNDPRYLEQLSTGNIGVVLGEKSGHLCAVDLDVDELVEPFLSANPQLADTLQTHGARGQVFWVKMCGDYPDTFTLKTSSGLDAGEFRSNGAQSVIAGIHPGTRQPYRFVVKEQPVEITYEEIEWPDEIRLTTSSTQLLCYSATLLLCKVQDAVEMALPKVKHQNNAALFKLARAVKTLEANGVLEGQEQRIEVFLEWYRQAEDRGILRAGQSCDDYLFEFLNAYRCAKQTLGETVVNRAWALAQTEPLPPESAVFQTDSAKRFVGLCYQMHRMADGGEWFIPTRIAARLLGVSHTQAATWFGGLVALGILHITENYTLHRATRYKFHGQSKNRKQTISKNL